MLSERILEYLGHLTLRSGLGKEIMKAIHNFLSQSKVEFPELIAVEYDSNTVNTEKHDGVIASLGKN